MIGTIMLSVFIQRWGSVDPVVHPLMSKTGRMPIRAWNTGFISFVLNGELTRQFEMPNWLNNDERVRFTWSPTWMRSGIKYMGSTGELLAFPQFSWIMDGELHTDEYYFFDGVMIWKYAGQWDSPPVKEAGGRHHDPDVKCGGPFEGTPHFHWSETPGKP